MPTFLALCLSTLSNSIYHGTSESETTGDQLHPLIPTPLTVDYLPRPTVCLRKSRLRNRYLSGTSVNQSAHYATFDTNSF